MKCICGTEFKVYPRYPNAIYCRRCSKSAYNLRKTGISPEEIDKRLRELRVDRECTRCKIKFSPKVHNQRYCSEVCEYKIYNKAYNKSHDISKYRVKGVCVKCNEFRRVRSDSLCESCINRLKHGKARKPNVGICTTCGRSALTLVKLQCRSCTVHGQFVGIGHSLSCGEANLRKCIKILYHDEDVIYNYRPDWLRKPTSRVSMELDVALPELKLAFEFDGRPHQDPKHPGFKASSENDAAKIVLCKDHGWTVVKIKSAEIIKTAYKLFECLGMYANQYYFGENITDNIVRMIQVHRP